MEESFLRYQQLCKKIYEKFFSVVFLNKETIGKFLVRDEYILRIKSGKYHERKRHFVAISPRREHQARGGTLWTFSATWNYGPESRSWRARMHARWSFRSCRIRRVTCEPPQTHHAQFTVSINRADGRTDRPTDRGRVVKRKGDIFGDAPRYCRARASSRMERAFVSAFTTP